MKLKTTEVDGKTYAEVQDGRPVYVDDDGKEIAFDAPGTRETIKRLNGEAKAHRERAESAEKGLKAYEGIEDPAAARDALSKIKSISEKDMIEAGKVEEIKAAAIKAVEEKYAPVVKERDELQGQLYGEKIGGSFARSKFATEKLAIPSDLIQARFGQNFKVEEGRIVATDNHGNKIYSRSKPGELAEFEEALEVLVDQYPHKDSILKGTGNSGTGSRGSNGGGGGQKQITRAEFEQLQPEQRMKTIADKVAVVDAA